jgi:hypothetical protein
VDNTLVLPDRWNMEGGFVVDNTTTPLVWKKDGSLDFPSVIYVDNPISYSFTTNGVTFENYYGIYAVNK